MRIESIEVDNFKSLVDFQLGFSKFNCLIGLNGAGKSTVLQFIDFLSALVRGEVKDWLRERHWRAPELRSKLSTRKNISFCVRFVNDKGKPSGRWEGQFSPTLLRCTSERLDVLTHVLETVKDEVRVFGVGNGRRSAKKDWTSSITFSYEGSILSSLKEDLLPDTLLKCKRFFQYTESLDMLTPERLRQRTRAADGSLGHGGRNLSAFVYELGASGRKELAKELKRAYSQLIHVYAKSLRSGWKQLQASERFGKSKVWTEAQHLNDGMLRLIAIVAELTSQHEFILFDEIENGINPELIEFVIDLLVSARQQVLVTTHSPMILNYLNDKTARDGVVYLYRTPLGFTKAIPFFSIPSIAEKLTVMGPGEAFADTNLTELGDEIETVTVGQ